MVEDVLIDVRPSTSDHHQLSLCCGGTTDQRVLDRVSRIGISAVVLVFTCSQIIRTSVGDAMMPVYTCLLGFVVGHWLTVRASLTPPSPRV
jgi:uncharacterized membrane protein